VIRVEKLRKAYGQNTAVDGISFEAQPGQIFGLLGPNGAGKTTTISIISGLIEPGSGSVLVDGRPIGPSAAAVKEVMGVVPQEVALYDDLTARENLAFWGSLYGLGGTDLKTRVGTMLDRIGLTERADDRVKAYSGGMKRRLNLAVGLLHSPRVVLLDEPTVGVDPQARISILEVIHEVARAGSTVLYTTHYLQEAEELCDRIAIMDHGRLLAEGSVAELKRMVGEGDVLTLRGRFSAEELRRCLEGAPDVRIVSLEDDHAMLSISGGRGVPDVLQGIFGSGAAIEEIAVRAPSLEQVFLKLTGRELRD
jgi:linearmycin/streptolysin S transport system ATP-binding protein